MVPGVKVIDFGKVGGKYLPVMSVAFSKEGGERIELVLIGPIPPKKNYLVGDRGVPQFTIGDSRSFCVTVGNLVEDSFLDSPDSPLQIEVNLRWMERFALGEDNMLVVQKDLVIIYSGGRNDLMPQNIVRYVPVDKTIASTVYDIIFEILRKGWTRGHGSGGAMSGTDLSDRKKQD